MKLIISTHFFFLSKIVKAFLLIKCHAKDSRGSGGIDINPLLLIQIPNKKTNDVINPEDEIIEILNKSIKDIPNLTIGAYNMSFDLKALKATAQKLGITGKLLKKSAKVQDIRSLCMETICNKHKSYERFVKENSLVTPGGNLSTTAETLFKYLTKDIEFIEDHTALSDSLIEAALWAYALRQKTKYERGIPESTFHLLKKAE